MTVATVSMGVMSLANSWTWAGMQGPAHRLTSRALGTAMGFLLPALTAIHALYFHWSASAEKATLNLLCRMAHALSAN